MKPEPEGQHVHSSASRPREPGDAGEHRRRELENYTDIGSFDNEELAPPDADPEES